MRIPCCPPGPTTNNQSPHNNIIYSIIRLRCIVSLLRVYVVWSQTLTWLLLRQKFVSKYVIRFALWIAFARSLYWVIYQRVFVVTSFSKMTLNKTNALTAEEQLNSLKTNVDMFFLIFMGSFVLRKSPDQLQLSKM